jgi:orotate phosphoribosyltransferase
MMTEAEVLDVLQKVGAVRSGHFVFTSGLHADTYVNKDAMYPYTHEVSKLCLTIAEHVKDLGIEMVIGPAYGAIILSTWTAYHLSELTGKEIGGVYADKDGQGGFIIKRGYDKLIAGKKILVVEDLTTTGGSIKKIVEAARAAGADVQAVVALFNRGGVTAERIGNPPHFISLVSLELEQWPADKCVLCERDIPVNTDIGHGREFLARKQNSAAGV